MSVADLNKRLAHLQERILELGLEGAFLLKPQNVYYFSGFNPIIQSHPVAVWIPAKGSASLILHALRTRHAKEEAVLDNLFLFGRWGLYGHDAPPDFFGAIKACLQQSGITEGSSLGVETDHMPVGFMHELNELFPGIRTKSVDTMILEQRLVKSDEEISFIEKAAWIADQGMEAGINAVKVGVTEAYISARTMTAMQEAWSRRYPDLEPVDFGTNEGGVLNALWSYCLSGPRMNMMCDSSKSRTIRKGDLVIIVIWSALNGYHAENERTISVGSAEGDEKHAFETILEARDNSLHLIRPGVPASTVYQAAIEVMIRQGFGDVLPGRIGHGLGLGAHEPFSLDPGNDQLLEENMVISFEPAIRIGEKGGIQHSDTLVITKDGFRFLTETERGIITV